MITMSNLHSVFKNIVWMIYMTKKIICEHCSEEIKYKADLVVANLFVNLETYHNECYAQGLKTAKTFFLNNHPINSIGGTMNALYSLLLSRSEEHTSELQSRFDLVCRLLLEHNKQL